MRAASNKLWVVQTHITVSKQLQFQGTVLDAELRPSTLTRSNVMSYKSLVLAVDSHQRYLRGTAPSPQLNHGKAAT